MPDNGNEPKQNSRDGLALVLGVIFIIGLVFATYTYFNKNATNNADLSSEESSALDKLKDIISSKTQRDDAAKEDTTTDKKDQPQVAGTSTTSVGPMWVATDYKNGDIKSGDYTVKQGDTLWEIAEAVYGDGTQWTKILEANKGSIGFLPNGSQALIVTGQALSIP